METTSYKLRLDTDDNDLPLELCLKYFNTYLISFEGRDTDNPHCHIFGTLKIEYKEPALRSYIRKAVGSGNGNYSLKKLDNDKPIEYLAYCLKEDTNPRHNLPEALFKEAEEYNQKVKEEIKQKKANRRTQLQIIIDDHCSHFFPSDENPNIYFYRTEPTKDDPNQYKIFVGKETIINLVINYFKETGTLIRQFALISIIQTLLLKYVPDYSRELYNKIDDQISFHPRN